MKNKILQIILLLAIVAIIVVLWQKQDYLTQNQPAEEGPISKVVVVKFEFDNDDVVQIQYPYSDPEEDLFAITQAIALEQNWGFQFEDYGEMGYLVTDINGYENGSDQKYWQYFADFEQPMLSVEKFVPVAGQLIEWKFIESEF